MVDGQQRLSTLTMLFSVLRAMMPDAADDITDFLYKKGALKNQVEDINKIGHDGQMLVKVMYKLLDGGYGFDAKFALDPPIGPSDPLSESNRKDWEFFATQERFRQWGKEQMFLSKREVLPPAELWWPVLPT